jgi:hypothetical protein
VLLRKEVQEIVWLAFVVQDTLGNPRINTGGEGLQRQNFWISYWAGVQTSNSIAKVAFDACGDSGPVPVHSLCSNAGTPILDGRGALDFLVPLVAFSDVLTEEAEILPFSKTHGGLPLLPLLMRREPGCFRVRLAGMLR